MENVDPNRKSGACDVRIKEFCNDLMLNVDNDPTCEENISPNVELEYLCRTVSSSDTLDKPANLKSNSSAAAVMVKQPHNGDKIEDKDDDNTRAADEGAVASNSSCSHDPNDCPVCQKAFNEVRDFKLHQVVHTAEGQCGKTFTKASDAKELERKLACDTCGKTFKQSSHLKNYKLTHTGEKKRLFF